MAKKKQDLSSEELLEQALVPEDEQPYKVPENWVWTYFYDVCKFENGFAFKSTEYRKSGVPLIRISNISEGEVDISKCVYIQNEKVDSRFIINYGDLLIALSGATTGKNGIYKLNIPAYLNQRVGNIKLISDSALLEQFRNYYLMDKNQEIFNNTYGGAQPNISAKKIGKMYFPLPPMTEQQRIVDRIENLFGKLDQAKGLIQDALESFENRKVAILHKAYTGELTKRWREENDVGMDSWEEKPLKEVVKFKTGYAFDSKSFSNTGYQVIRMGNLYNGVLDLSRNPVHISPELIDCTIVSKYSVNKGDILLTLTGTKYKRDYGYAVLIKESNGLLLNQRILALTPDIMEINYILYYLQSDFFRDVFFSSETGGVNQGNVSPKFVENIKIPVASLVEQKEIVRILDAIFGKEQNAKELYDLIDNIDLMKKSILARAFRGELGTNDSSEESALELLKEVLAQQ